MITPGVTMLQLGITAATHRYEPATHRWCVTVARDEGGDILFGGVGFGPDPDSAAFAALHDFRQQIAKALGGGAEVVA